MANTKIWVENGTVVDATWTESIAISTDGVHWETINKAGLDVRARLVNKNPASPLVSAAAEVRVTLARSSKNETVFEFGTESVQNQAGWLGNTPTSMAAAVSDITEWLGASGSGGAGATEATLLLLQTENAAWGETDNLAIVSDKFPKVGGRAVRLPYAPAYTQDDAANLAIDDTNGGLLVNQANLAVDEDEVLAFLGAKATNEGAADKYRTLLASKTGLVVKASAGNLYKFNVINASATIFYLKFYDKATTPDNTDVPVLTIPVPSGIGSFVSEEYDLASYFAAGISFRAVAGILDNDNVSATPPIVEIEYK